MLREDGGSAFVSIVMLRTGALFYLVTVVSHFPCSRANL